MLKHYNLQVTGKVQGVGLRFLSLKKSYELGIKGYVKNLEDKNSIYYEIEGEEESISKFISWLRKGVPFAEVKDIVTEENDIKNYPTFEIIHRTKVKFIPA